MYRLYEWSVFYIIYTFLFGNNTVVLQTRFMFWTQKTVLKGGCDVTGKEDKTITISGSFSNGPNVVNKEKSSHQQEIITVTT